MSYQNSTKKYYNPPFMAKMVLLILLLAGGVAVDRKVLHGVFKIRKGQPAISKVEGLSRQAGFNR